MAIRSQEGARDDAGVFFWARRKADRAKLKVSCKCEPSEERGQIARRGPPACCRRLPEATESHRHCVASTEAP